MKHLINHLIANNIDEIVSKSLLNCHCKGLHSIMLLDAPEKRIRLYVAVKGNDMIKNTYINFFAGNELSIAFHPHHCNLTLHCIKGSVLNWCVDEVSETEQNTKESISINKWKYHSHINEGEMAFELLGKAIIKNNTDKSTILIEGDCVQMKASDIHTVACSDIETTAWLVYEGKEDPEYTSLCYSNTDLNNQTSEGLYQRPTKKEVMELLEMTDLLK